MASNAKNSVIFDKEWLIVCEGPGDKNVLCELLSQHDIYDNFNVRFPGKEDFAAGRGAIVPWLNTVADASSTFDVVKAILIIADNDDDPVSSLDEILSGLKSIAKKRFGVPTAEKQFVRGSGAQMPALGILMIPMGKQGNLETLCVEGALTKWPLLGAPLNTYVAATPGAEWTLSRQSKMQMQCLLAVTCKPQPETTIQHLWQHDSEYHVPLDTPSFIEIADFLKNFGHSLAASGV